MKPAAVGVVASCAALAVAARSARADLPPPPPEPSGYDQTGYVGIEASLLPYGTFRVQSNAANLALDSDAEVAYALGASFTYQVSEYISFGFAPRILFHVESQDEGQDAKEIDLRARVRAGTPVVGPLRLFAELSGGYSFVLESSSAGGPDPLGFLFGGGIGGSYGLVPGMSLELLVGYQFGFQGISETYSVGGVKMSQSAQESDNYLEVTVAFVKALW